METTTETTVEREVASVVGLSCLNDHRMPLRWTRHVERPVYREPLAVVLDGVDFAPVELTARQGVVLPRIP